MNGIQESQKSGSARNANQHTGTGLKKKEPYPKPSNEDFKKYLEYCPETGDFFWRKASNNNGALKGNRAGYVNTQGYVVIGLKNKYFYAHRLAWFFAYGYFPENEIDHIDRNPQNNKISNLREVSSGCNNHNSKVSVCNHSAIKGVYFYKRDKKWAAYITINKKYKYLGRFKTKIEAAIARYNAEKTSGIFFYGETSAYKFIKASEVYPQVGKVSP